MSIHNFNAGPAALPRLVLEQAQAEMLDFRGAGMSLLEMSHRSSLFEGLMQETEADLRSLLGLPDDFKALFLQGGASLQFGMIPMNLRPAGASADYIVNGAWGTAALKDAVKQGAARAAGSSQETGFDRFPEALDCDPAAAYLHFTSNETIHGVQLSGEPQPPAGVPLICDMSSDFLSRPVDVEKYSLIYAGAQKNAGPAGVTLVLLREALLARTPSNLPVMLDYRAQAAAGSMHNTPPCFAIYMVGLVLKWLNGLGGLAAIAARNQEKAALVYAAIDRSGGFYRGHALPAYRSLMNVTFRLPSGDLEKEFVRQAEAEGLVGLKGHRSVGGLRASLYNALPLESAQALAQFMAEFQRKNG
ncbi:MAG: 3-phosphoserine/phosphohydroxythreonine transaminase [Chloroflexi bacterium]|nr:3-phosphoserine/phosphohydroxythreonine transaminase [Chloroflexota bacterium]